MKEDAVGTVGYRLRRLIERESATIIEKTDLRMVELEILVYLKYAGAADTASDIISARSISKAHTSKSIDHLRQKGYILLEEDPVDRRKMHLHLSDLADAVIWEVAAVRKRCADIMFEGIPEDKIQIMNEVMAQASKNLDEALLGRESRK